MAIYEPRVELSDADREALSLLARLVLASEEEASHNAAPEGTPLSIAQARRLLKLLEQLFSSRKFVEGTYFVEGISNGHGWKDPRLREIYLSWHRRFGRTRANSTYKWNDFVVRSGFSTSQDAWLWPRSGAATYPMEYSYFLEMERRLAKAAGLHPRVSALVMRFLESRESQIEQLRKNNVSMKEGTLRAFAMTFLDELKRITNGDEQKSMGKRKLVAVTTLVMDTGTLFITRDWTATATISMIGSTFPDLVE